MDATAQPTQSPTRLAPAEMPAVGAVDERYQSYNIEMVEVMGGKWWTPYASPAAVGAKAPSSGVDAATFRYQAPIDLANPRLR